MGAGLSFGRSVPALPLLVLAFANTAAAQMVTVKERAYWGVVTLYAQGDRGNALASILTWTESDLGRIRKSVEALEKAARRCGECEEQQRFDAVPLRAAILLHAERDRTDRAAMIRESGGAAECAVSAHGRMSEQLIALAARQAGGVEFVSRFAAANSLYLRSVLCFATGRHWAGIGLEVSPGDAMLHLADGLASETIGTTGFVEPTFRRAADSRGRPVYGYADVNRKQELKRALGALEKALASNPRLSEARLRAGRVLWRLGRGREAQDSLRRAVIESEGALRYLAHLFLGQCLEDEGNLAGAIDQYAAAVALRPETQIGAVALAHAHSLDGRSERAREILEGALALSGRRPTADPYWTYLTGAPDLTEALLDRLRAESLR